MDAEEIGMSFEQDLAEAGMDEAFAAFFNTTKSAFDVSEQPDTEERESA